ncbi:MAG: NifU family protein [Parachlamydiales bacterium]|nr:NifU family protein [Parachlamydiales bacterium]
MDWHFSKKLQQKIASPYCQGELLKNPEDLSMRVICFEKDNSECKLKLFWLIDLLDATVVDARFMAFGPPALVGALEAACELSIGKVYNQAGRIGVDLIDRYLQDRTDVPAFPKSAFPILNYVVEVVEELSKLCVDIPLPEAAMTPLPEENIDGGGYTDWPEYSDAQKLVIIEEIIAKDIRPYIELDAGGIQIVEIKNGSDIYISYQGACTSCYSATGSTLNSIQQILRAKVHPSIKVIPNL